MKVRLKDIGLQDLDRQSEILLSSFIQSAKLQGVNLEIDDDEIIHRVFNLGLTTSDPSLRMVFLSLRRRMRKRLSEQRKQLKPGDRPWVN